MQNTNERFVIYTYSENSNKQIIEAKKYVSLCKKNMQQTRYLPHLQIQ